MSTPPHTSHTQSTPSDVACDLKTLKHKRSKSSSVESVGSSESTTKRPTKCKPPTFEIFQTCIAMGEGVHLSGRPMGSNAEPSDDGHAPGPTLATSRGGTDNTVGGSRSSGRCRDRSAASLDEGMRRAIDNLHDYIEAKQAKLAKQAKDEGDLQQCLESVASLPGVPQRQYFKAIGHFVKRAGRRVFLSLSERDRFAWVMSL